MYLRSFLCEEAKIEQRTPSKKELCEISEGAIWESRFTSFFSIRIHYAIFDFEKISEYKYVYFIQLYVKTSLA